MAQFNSIHANIWEDERFRRLKNSDSKILFFHLFSNQRCPISGIYKISPETMSFETGIVPDCRVNLEEIIQAGLVSYDYERNVVWVRGKIKHDRSWTAPMRVKSIRRSLAEFSSCSFMQNVFEKYPFLKELAIEEEIKCKTFQGHREPEAALEAEVVLEKDGYGEGMGRVSGGINKSPLVGHEKTPQRFRNPSADAWK